MLNVIQNPAGTFCVVGFAVPAELIYNFESSVDLQNCKHVGFTIAQGIAKLEGRTFSLRLFNTQLEAEDAVANYASQQKG